MAKQDELDLANAACRTGFQQRLVTIYGVLADGLAIAQDDQGRQAAIQRAQRGVQNSLDTFRVMTGLVNEAP